MLLAIHGLRAAEVATLTPDDIDWRNERLKIRKRPSLPDTHFLARDEVAALFRSLPRQGHLAPRDDTLLLFLYNTGASVDTHGLKSR